MGVYILCICSVLALPIPTFAAGTGLKLSNSLSDGLKLSNSAGSPDTTQRPLPLPFHIPVTQKYVGGSDNVDVKQTNQMLLAYEAFLNYNKLAAGLDYDVEDFLVPDSCVGNCPRNSHCLKGMCVCDQSQGFVQKYGRCFPKSQASFVGDKEKYRKPSPPPRPQYCFCEMPSGGEGVCAGQKNNPECQERVFPNTYDWDNQRCSPGAHLDCLGKDINMFCGESGRCQCRKDMSFDPTNMECRLYFDVDCPRDTRESGADSRLDRILLGKSPANRVYSEEEARNGFCNLFDKSLGAKSGDSVEERLVDIEKKLMTVEDTGKQTLAIVKTFDKKLENIKQLIMNKCN